METISVKFLCILGLVALIGISVSSKMVNGAGECPNSTPDAEAIKLLPCATAAQKLNAPVSVNCCARVKQLGTNPKCLCAVLLSKMAKSSGVNLKIAMSIPKRCNLAHRPVGYKCGAYTLP